MYRSFQRLFSDLLLEGNHAKMRACLAGIDIQFYILENPVSTCPIQWLLVRSCNHVHIAEPPGAETLESGRPVPLQGSFPTQEPNGVSCTASGFFTTVCSVSKSCPILGISSKMEIYIQYVAFIYIFFSVGIVF